MSFILCSCFKAQVCASVGAKIDIPEVMEQGVQQDHEVEITFGGVVDFLYHDFPFFEEIFVLWLPENYIIFLMSHLE